MCAKFSDVFPTLVGAEHCEMDTVWVDWLILENKKKIAYACYTKENLHNTREEHDPI